MRIYFEATEPISLANSLFPPTQCSRSEVSQMTSLPSYTLLGFSGARLTSADP